MGLIQINIADIAELGTQVAMHGAMGAGEVMGDEIFEIIVGLIAVVVEMTS